MFESESLAREVVARCQSLVRFSEDGDGLRRTFLCPPMRDVHRAIAAWAEDLGCATKLDAAGNLRMIYPAAAASAPRLLMGSHLDTVPNAGAYDGVLGVLLPLALLAALAGRKLPFAIEVVGFSEEEGVRFGAPFIGSRALAGTLDEALLDLQDASGVSVRQAIADFGLNPAEIAAAEISSEVRAYIEFHIEQGPVLESAARPLGVVEAIAGQTRMEFFFLGHANHAGTTPMNLRYDAVAAAAEWIACVERRAQAVAGLVATVGTIAAKPGAVNVIAAEARATLDVRHALDPVRSAAVEHLRLQGQQIAARRGLEVRWNLLLDQSAVPMDSALIEHVAEAARSAGCDPLRMVSGAGHDAMVLADRVPAAMIFLRTPGGISHDPKETVAVADVANAIECGMFLLDRLASWSGLKATEP